MSSTEIFAFGQDGNVKETYDIKNSFRGAFSIWEILEKKYLPSLEMPIGLRGLDKLFPEMKYRSRLHFLEDKTQEIWDLYKRKDIPEHEKIVLGCTFDNVLIKKENFKQLIEAFRKFDGETSLKEQADIIENLGSDIIAIGFNQTSVNGDTWDNYNYSDEKEESYSYNCLTQDKHWWLFE